MSLRTCYNQSNTTTTALLRLDKHGISWRWLVRLDAWRRREAAGDGGFAAPRAGIRAAVWRAHRPAAAGHPAEHAAGADQSADLPRPDRHDPAQWRRRAPESAGPGPGADPGPDRGAGRVPAQDQRRDRRGRDLRPAGGALYPLAAHVAGLLHQYQGRRADEPPQQRRDRRPARDQQYGRGHRHQSDPGRGDPGRDADPGLAADPGGGGRHAAVHRGGAAIGRARCASSPARGWSTTPR